MWLLFSCAECKRGVEWKGTEACGGGRGGGLSRSAPGVLPAQKALATLLREMRNDHILPLLFSVQMRYESLIGEEPGAWAHGCLAGSLIR